MKIYLAARYTRLPELNHHRSFLRSLGHDITSRWLDGHHQASNTDLLGEQAPEHDRTRFALEDWEDLAKADMVINFTEAPRTTNSRGGRHVEFGAALAMGKITVVIGPRENVFHCLPGIRAFESWKDFVTWYFERFSASEEDAANAPFNELAKA